MALRLEKKRLTKFCNCELSQRKGNCASWKACRISLMPSRALPSVIRCNTCCSAAFQSVRRLAFPRGRGYHAHANLQGARLNSWHLPPR
eukprot:479490-Prorocentrum_lima.AAC.1